MTGENKNSSGIRR